MPQGRNPKARKEAKTMKETTNTYFQSMESTIREYNNAKRTNREEKDFPFNQGQMTAFWAWKSSIDFQSTCNGESVLEVSGLPQTKDIHNFVTCLRDAGVDTFATTDESTALLRSLHALSEEDCQMIGLCKVIRTETYNGILMSL